nr:biopolymer transporter ExbD [uncultured Psychroserpens sp.]
MFYFKSLTDKIQYDNSVDLELPITTPNDTIQNDNVVNVLIKEDLSIYVDSIKRDIKDLEGILINRAVNDSLTIVLGAEKSVPVSNIIDVMTVANKHKFKTILAVKPEM